MNRNGKNPMDFPAARDLLLDVARAVDAQDVPLCACFGRVLAQDVTAAAHAPPFDRSPYDGYAFRAGDSAGASKRTPVTLRVVEEVPAGAVPTMECTPGTAVKILTGAPIPAGADAVVPYERTEFTAQAVTLFAPAEPGDNIVRAGEDVRKGTLLAARGSRIDPGAAGTLAAQGIARPEVYRTPKVGVLSTGNEVAEVGEALRPGTIYNSNRYTLSAALRALGCEPVYLGLAGDDAQAIAALLRRGLESCDAVVSSGGVSAGDYDLTPEAMERAGARVLFRGVKLKPGMACAYGEKEGKLICALSGNPASALTNFYALAAPALKKLTGAGDYLPEEISLTLGSEFPKKSPATRLLRGRLDLTGGAAVLRISEDQGNVVLRSAIGCDAMAVVPAGSGPLPAGTALKGFLL